MLDELARDDVLRTVDAMVAELLDAARITAPPIDVIALAQAHLDFTVCIDSRQPQRGRAQRTLGKKQIYLKPEPREERHQWTVAHEIGEHLKSELLARLGIEPGQTRAMVGESLANLFAQRLLVPTPWFKTDAPSLGYDLLALKARYATSSHEVLAMRFLDLPAPCVVTIIDNEKVSRRKGNAFALKKALLPIEKRCWEQVTRTSESATMREAEWTVTGWPVHELDWKREILRTERDEW